MSSRRAIVALAALAASAGIVALCRAAAAHPQISVQLNEVSVPVTVTDARGDFVAGLGRDHFHLYVDGAERPIDYFSAERDPAQVLLLIETGPAVYLLRHEHTAAALLLLQGLGADDRAAVASYSDAPRLLADFSADKRQAAAALDGMAYGLGMADLNFYDSLGAALDWAASAAPSNSKSAIVVLTTGLDSSGAGHWEQLERKLARSNVMVLPVALGGELRGTKSHDAKSPSAASVDASFAAIDQKLEAIAAASGGHAFFPRTTPEFQAAYRHIAALLRHEYDLGFAAEEHDGARHAIRVEVTDAGGKPLLEKNRKAKYAWNARREFLAPAP